MRRFGKALCSLAAVVLMTAATAWAVLHTSWGRARVAAWAEGRISRAFDGRVALHGASGRFPGRVAVERLALSDDAGLWLTASNVVAEIRLRDLVRRPPFIREIDAERVDWLRMPRARGETDTTSGRRLRLPALGIGRMTVSEGHLDAVVAGEPVDVRLTGRLSSDHDRLSAAVDIESPDGVQRLAATCSVRAADAQLALAAHAEDRGGGLLCRRLAGLDVTGLVADLGAKGWGPTWAGDVAMRSSDGRSVSGHVEVAEGSRFSVDAGMDGIVVPAGHLAVEPARARVVLTRAGGRLAGTLDGEGQCSGRKVSASGDVAMIGKGYIFTNLLLKAAGARVRGGLYVVNGRPAGRLRATVEDPDAFAWLSGTHVKGRGTADVRIRPDRIRAVWQASDLAAGEWTLSDATGRVTFAREPGAWAVAVDAVARDLDRRGIRCSNVVVRASGRHAVYALRIRADGAAADRAFEAELAAQAHSAPGGATVEVTEFKSMAAGRPVVMTEPFALQVAPGAVSWTRAELTFADGRFASEGRVQKDRVDVRASLDHLPLAALAFGSMPAMEGELTGSLTLGGTASEPVGRVNLRLAQARPSVSPGFVFAPTDISLCAAYSNSLLTAALELAGWSDEPVRASVEWPVAATLLPWRFEAVRNGHVAGALRAGFDLSRLRSLADLRGSVVQGVVTCELTVAGTPALPDVSGRVSLRDGRFEFPDSGTVLQNVQVTLVGDRERLMVKDASASDGGQGRVEMEGHVLFRPADSFPIDAALVLKKAELWRQGGSRVMLDGRLALTGNLREVLLAGSLKVPQAEIQLARPRPTIVTLEVRGLEGIAARGAREPSRWRGRVRLALKVTGRGIKVTGRGLESTWSGDVQVAGRADAPQVTGHVDVERGYFLFMGRRFALDRGSLSLDGRYPPAPELSVSASSRAADMVARLDVVGPVSEPSLVLDSDPSYPSDEILSRLLFGKSVDSVTPLQAVRLAYGLELLRGHGTTLDVLDRGQSILRVDQLELKQNDTSGELSSVSVGKYIGRSVYVQGEKALGQAEDVISVEVEVTPSLILQTETSPRIREGVGIKWRRDY